MQTVHAETDGNPFFVEEVVRHLIETGVRSSRGRWTSALPDEIGVPEGVKEVLGRRLGAAVGDLPGGCSPTPPCSAASSASTSWRRCRATTRTR